MPSFRPLPGCLLLLITGCLPVFAHADKQTVITVITSDAWPITGIQRIERAGYQVKIHNLDAPTHLAKRLAKGLPLNENAAKQTLSQRFKRMGIDAVRQQFMDAAQAQTLALRYGIRFYPAVLFNQGQAVVYGVTDLPLALKHYRHWNHR